jgi:hypothetical protein
MTWFSLDLGIDGARIELALDDTTQSQKAFLLSRESESASAFRAKRKRPELLSRGF